MFFKYTNIAALFLAVIHAYAKAGAANKAQELLSNMHKMYKEGNLLAKPDTITVRVFRLKNASPPYRVATHEP